MRFSRLGAAGLALIAVPAAGEAATILVYHSPETLERRLLVVRADGPDRLFYCLMPPAEAGCQQVPIRRRRG